MVANLVVINSHTVKRIMKSVEFMCVGVKSCVCRITRGHIWMKFLWLTIYLTNLILHILPLREGSQGSLILYPLCKLILFDIEQLDVDHTSY